MTRKWESTHQGGRCHVDMNVSLTGLCVCGGATSPQRSGCDGGLHHLSAGSPGPASQFAFP